MWFCEAFCKRSGMYTLMHYLEAYSLIPDDGPEEVGMVTSTVISFDFELFWLPLLLRIVACLVKHSVSGPDRTV